MTTDPFVRAGWPDDLPVAYLRFARPTRSLEAITHFYGELLGLRVIAHFEDHAGYSGVVFGLPDAAVQLELTWQPEGPVPAPAGDDLLVLYLADAVAVQERLERLAGAGYRQVKPENPYWERELRGSMVVDPDGYRVILVAPPLPDFAGGV